MQKRRAPAAVAAGTDQKARELRGLFCERAPIAGRRRVTLSRLELA
jgi:hypothetical protein